MKETMGQSLVEATIAITLLAGALWILSTLLSSTSMQLARVEQRKPSHVRVSFSDSLLSICMEGAEETTADAPVEILSIRALPPTANPKLELEVAQ